MATDTISERAQYAAGPPLDLSHRPEPAGRVQALPVEDRWAASPSSIEPATQDDYQWLERWYPFFMAGLLLAMVMLGGFWISQFVR